MAAIASIREITRNFTSSVKRNSLLRICCFVQNESFLSRQCLNCITFENQRSYRAVRPSLYVPYVASPLDFSLQVKPNVFPYHNILCKCLHSRYMSDASIELKTDEDVIRFSFNKPLGRFVSANRKGKTKSRKMSKKAKLNELRFYRLKAKKKMNSPNPEVRIRYKLEKALEKYKYEQSLDHTSEFIEKLEKELEAYLEHKARYQKAKESTPQDFVDDNGCKSTLS